MIALMAHGFGILPLHEPLGKAFGFGFPFGLPPKRTCDFEERKRRGTFCLLTASMLPADSRFHRPHCA
jgi:hypothetical protein